MEKETKEKEKENKGYNNVMSFYFTFYFSRIRY